ncbi:glutathione S-transferase N-terminal domain-containing protein [Thorsellia anophelis]|uniref:RNA polymerase-associated protein n=1 Tax=Thorsellia anophelis DSM 18579 TaxID=1123402 RepID=A0A1I0DQG3_9GAMM|nr:glutathione S-transferase N-terminal domain-containing protein [Thorsellia anophelis]SET34486.1 RNA polymerase-associated protein [Thorsellia anophelis DSM 18579]
MGLSVNKRSALTLFSGKSDIRSHQIRFMLAEKGVMYELELVTPNRMSDDLLALNPYGTIPTLVDRELTLYYTHIIAEYIDERFPHPSLMPVYPQDRASTRLMLNRIEQDWYPLADKALFRDEEGDRSRRRLRDELLSLAPIFRRTPFFLNDEFSIIDCALAPLLWRLTHIGIEILDTQSAKDIRPYMKRVFNRDGFLNSLTPIEKEMRSSY